MFRNTRNGAWYFQFFQSLFQFCFETTETFGLSQFLSCFSQFQFFPYIIHCFSVSKHQKWGLVFSLFPELVSILFRNVLKQLKHLDLVNFLLFQSISIFPLYNPLFQCFETSEMGSGIFTFSYLVSILFQNVSKQLKHLDLVNFCLFQSVSIFSLYNPLFQCFETPEMGPGIFTFFRACFNFVSKRFETTETFGLSQFLSCFSQFQFFPYIIHCFSVSKHQKWGLVFFTFSTACFNFVLKRLETTERYGLSQFLSCFSPFQFFPYIIHCFSVSKHQKWAWYFHFFQSLFQFCFETFRNN